MFKLKIFCLFLLIPSLLFAQEPILLTQKTRTAIVNTISALLLDNYVFPETAVKMSNQLKKKLNDGKYDNIKDPIAFSDALTIELLAVYHDGHLLVQYAPEENETTPLPLQDPTARIKKANFGLSKVEVLPGNIGYLNLTNFWADNMYGKETVKAALQFVSNTNALIIDLRNCGDGSQETVALICGYFLEKSTHINDMFDRSTNTITEFWTKPDPSFTAMANMPLYILTSNKTFSAAEEFCYDLQSLKRATIVGETSGGGAHGTFTQNVGNGFTLHLPYATAINPTTKTNWEKIGVKPEIETPADKALETAEIKIMDTLIAKTTDSADLFQLQWDRDLLYAINNPLTLDNTVLQKFEGEYGEKKVTLENGKLFYQRTGRPKFELEAMSPTFMKGKGNTYFKIEFIDSPNGVTNTIKTYYQDDRVETSKRTK